MHLGLGHNYILLPPSSPSLLTPFFTGSEKGVKNFAASSHPLSSSPRQKGSRWLTCEGDSVGAHEFILLRNGPSWSVQWWLSYRRHPSPPPTCWSPEGIYKSSSLQRWRRISFQVISQGDSWFFTTVSQERKTQKNTLAWDRKGKLRFWHSGNEHQWTGSYVSSKKNIPCHGVGMPIQEAGLWGCNWHQAQGHLPRWEQEMRKGRSVLVLTPVSHAPNVRAGVSSADDDKGKRWWRGKKPHAYGAGLT